MLLTPSAKSCNLACLLRFTFSRGGLGFIHQIQNLCFGLAISVPLDYPTIKYFPQVITILGCFQKVSTLRRFNTFRCQKQAYSRCKASHLGHFAKGQICSTESLSGPIKTVEFSPIIHYQNSFILTSFFRRFIVDDGRNCMERYAFLYKIH